MSAEPVEQYILTAHAQFEMERRGLDEAVIREVLRAPEQRSELRPGRHVLQSRLRLGEPPRAYLVRVIVDVDRTPHEVVTAYRTSRMARYGREDT